MRLAICCDCAVEIIAGARGMLPKRCDACRLKRDRQRKAKWDAEHREEIRARNDAYNAAHPDRNSRIGKSWRERNPDKVKAYNALRKVRRDALKQNLEQVPSPGQEMRGGEQRAA